MKTVFKYRLGPGMQTVLMPVGAEPLCVRWQHDGISLWCKVDTDQPEDQAGFCVYGTGHPMAEAEQTYIGTVEDPRSLIWHCFAVHPMQVRIIHERLAAQRTIHARSQPRDA